MISGKNIIITGFMGAGKSTVGKKIASMLKRDFYDTDKIIEKEQNRTISNIFREDGEDYFRLLEKLVVTDISRKTDFVIASGGGTLLNKDNLEMLTQTGIVFCLTANIDILISRMGNRKSRPMVAEKNRAAILELYESRINGYNKLPNQIDTSNTSPQEVADTIIELFNKLHNSLGVIK